MSILILRFTVLQLGGCVIVCVTRSSKIFRRTLQDVEVFSSACVSDRQKRPRRRLLPEIPGSFGTFLCFSASSHASFVKSPSPLNTRKPLTRRSGQLSPPEIPPLCKNLQVSVSC